MRKMLLSSIFFLTACSSIFSYDKEFKNPIFYQPLRPLSKTVGYIYLAPTSVKFRGVLNENKTIYEGKCDLIENTQDRITLKCEGAWDDGTKYNSYLTYVIKEIPLFMPNCLRILEYSYNKLEDFPKNEIHSTKYCVTPPKK